MIDLGFEEVVNAILDAIPTTNLKSQDEALALQQVRRPLRRSCFTLSAPTKRHLAVSPDVALSRCVAPSTSLSLSFSISLSFPLFLRFPLIHPFLLLCPFVLGSLVVSVRALPPHTMSSTCLQHTASFSF